MYLIKSAIEKKGGSRQLIFQAVLTKKLKSSSRARIEIAEICKGISSVIPVFWDENLPGGIIVIDIIKFINQI